MFIFLSALLPIGFNNYYNISRLQEKFQVINTKQLKDRTDITVNFLRQRVQSISKIAKDNGIWTVLYEQVKQKNTTEDWYKNNLTGWKDKNVGLAFIAIFHNDHKLLASTPLDNQLKKELLAKPFVAKTLEHDYDHFDASPPTGIDYINGKFYMISVCPILPDDRNKPSVGALVMAEEINTPFLMDLSTNIGCAISLEYNGTFIDSHTPIRTEADKKTSHYTHHSIPFVLENLTLNNALTLHLYFSDKYSGEVKSILNQSTLRTLYITLFFVVFTLLLAYLWLVKPVHVFVKDIDDMASKSEIHALPVKGPHEVKFILLAFNRLVAAIQSHSKENQTLFTQTMTDDLTGLYNYRGFVSYLKNLDEQNENNVVLIFCDIDHFKVINDTFGHPVGDKVLKLTADILKQAVEPYGKIFRYGGEEFVIGLTGYNLSLAMELSEKIRRSIETSQEILHVMEQFRVTISLGIAEWPTHAEKIHQLVKLADMALYRAKEQGRNNVVVYQKEKQSS